MFIVKVLICLLLVNIVHNNLKFKFNNFYYTTHNKTIRLFINKVSHDISFKENIKKIAFIKNYIFIQDSDDKIVIYNKKSGNKLKKYFKGKYKLIIFDDIIVLYGLKNKHSHLIHNNIDNENFKLNKVKGWKYIYSVADFYIINNLVCDFNNDHELYINKNYKKVELSKKQKIIMKLNKKRYSILNENIRYYKKSISKYYIINGKYQIKELFSRRLNHRYVLKSKNGENFISLFENNNYEKMEKHIIIDFYLSYNNKNRVYKFILYFKFNTSSKFYNLLLVDDRNRIEMQLYAFESIKNISIKRKFNKVYIYDNDVLLKKLNFILNENILNKMDKGDYGNNLNNNTINIFLNKRNYYGNSEINLKSIEEKENKLQFILNKKQKIKNELYEYSNYDVLKLFKNLEYLKNLNKNDKFELLKKLFKLYNYMELNDLGNNIEEINNFSETNINDLFRELNN